MKRRSKKLQGKIVHINISKKLPKKAQSSPLPKNLIPVPSIAKLRPSPNSN